MVKNKKNLKQSFIKTLIIVAIFIFLDYLAHLFGILIPLNSLLPGYFLYKTIISLIYIWIALYYYPKLNIIVISIILAIVLQVYRYLGVYTLQENLFMIVGHTIYIFAGLLIVTNKKLMKKIGIK